METPASSFKLPANAPKGRKRFPIKSLVQDPVTTRLGLATAEKGPSNAPGHEVAAGALVIGPRYERNGHA